MVQVSNVLTGVYGATIYGAAIAAWANGMRLKETGLTGKWKSVGVLLFLVGTFIFQLDVVIGYHESGAHENEDEKDRYAYSIMTALVAGAAVAYQAYRTFIFWRPTA